MKVLCTGDWHITDKRPRCRTDDYYASVRRKLNWIFEMAVKEKCDFILQPGDFFDSHRASDFLKQDFMSLLIGRDLEIFTVYGQHDLRFHGADRRNTPLKVLEAAGKVEEILGSSEMRFFGVLVQGCSWGEDVPEIKEDKYNILVIHRMFVKDKKSWSGQEDVTFAGPFMKQHRFDCVVAGDNHQTIIWNFGTKDKPKYFINCGSLMRSTIAQADHEPIVVILDTEKRTIDVRRVPVEPAEKVMNLAIIEKEREQNLGLELFMSTLMSSEQGGVEGLDFMKALSERAKGIDEDTSRILEEVFDGAV
jgi:hypothetical protein